MPDVEPPRAGANPRVGVIGLGAMGGPMAGHLLNAGFEVVGFDLNQEATERFAREGGQLARSASDAAAASDLLLLVVMTDRQVDDILFGAGGVAAALAPGKIVWLATTAPPHSVQSAAAKLAERGILTIDGPVSGGVVGARSGELTIMASGPAAALARADAAMAAVSRRVFQLGETVGTASVVKLVNQLLTGCNIALAAEAMALGIRAGADPKALYEVVINSAGTTRQFELKVPRMLAHDYEPLSSINIFLKDLGIVMETAERLRFPTPIASAAFQMFQMAAAKGWGRDGETSIMRLYSGFDPASDDVGSGEKRG